MGHRYYDPGTGRFLTRYPMGYGGGINLYGFAGNDPVNGMDPSGLDFSDYASGMLDAVNPWQWVKGGVALARYLGSGHASAGQLGRGLLTGLNPIDPNASDRQMGSRAMGNGLIFAGGLGLFSKVGKFAAAADAAEAAGAVSDTSGIVSRTPVFGLADRVTAQLADPRLGPLAGKLTGSRLNQLLNNPSAQRLYDTSTGNINVVQNVDGVLLRITTPRDVFRIISVGPIRAKGIANGIKSGRFIVLR